MTKPVTGLEEICDEMIRVDVSSQDANAASMVVDDHSLEVQEECFSVMPQGNLYYKAAAANSKVYPQRGTTSDGLYHSKNVVLPNAQQSCFRVGGARDSECALAVKTCMLDDKPVKSMNSERGMVGLCVAMLRSEQIPTYVKDYVIAFGGCAQKRALKTVEKYSIKADMWMALPDLITACMSASGTILLDHLYVFGGKNEFGQYLNRIERLNLKNSGSKFEPIEVQMPEAACDVGLLPLRANQSSAEVLILGGYNGNCLDSQHRFTAAASC